MENPYGAPFEEPERRNYTEEPSYAVPRPLGVTILAGLMMLGGVILLGVVFFILGSVNSPAVEAPKVLVGAGIVLIVGLVLAASVGMWRGTYWGWWCGSYWFAYAVFKSLFTVIALFVVTDPNLGTAQSIGYLVAKHSTRTCINTVCFFYMFKPGTLAYFNLEHMNRGRIMRKLIAIALFLAGLQVTAKLLS